MQVQQVFIEYPLAIGAETSNLTYCPRCGENCVIKEEGGRKRSTCLKCGFIHYKNPVPAVSVLIVKDETVLLGKRAPGSFQAGKWCLPCGYLEFDEDFITAARREAKEETGLIIEIESILSVMSNFFTPALHTLVVVLLARVTAGTLCSGDDLVAAQWVPLAGPFPNMAFAADEHIIARYCMTRVSGAPVETRLARSSGCSDY